MKFIRLDAVLAEIERRIKRFREEKDSVSIVKTNTYKGILSFLNTLEVKEVNLDKEYEKYVEEDPVYNKLVNDIVGKSFAKHFFELGLNANNPLTYEDIEMIGKLRLKVALDLRNKELESSINNPIKFTEEDFCKEVLKRFKEQKGELL